VWRELPHGAVQMTIPARDPNPADYRIIANKITVERNGVGKGFRTPDLRIHNPAL
jgi:hypothetical protein